MLDGMKNTAEDRAVIERVVNCGAEALQAFVERIEAEEERKAEIADGIKEIYAEAKSAGYDVSTIKTVVKRRKVDAAQLAEAEAVLDVYLRALGMR